MAQEEVKKQAFEYVLYKLVEWYKQAYNTNSEENDISVLKALKLLFFISAVGTKSDSIDTLLDNTFDNFVAMPFGHVESDVYSLIKRKEIQNHININNKGTTIISFNPDSVNEDLKKRIDNSFDKLKTIHFNLIKYSSFDLVDLSHAWYSWQYFYNQALTSNSKSCRIETSYIKSEEKIYAL